jgi:hypothetical protein
MHSEADTVSLTLHSDCPIVSDALSLRRKAVYTAYPSGANPICNALWEEGGVLIGTGCFSWRSTLIMYID